MLMLNDVETVGVTVWTKDLASGWTGTVWYCTAKRSISHNWQTLAVDEVWSLILLETTWRTWTQIKT